MQRYEAGEDTMLSRWGKKANVSRRQVIRRGVSQDKAEKVTWPKKAALVDYLWDFKSHPDSTGNTLKG